MRLCFSLGPRPRDLLPLGLLPEQSSEDPVPVGAGKMVLFTPPTPDLVSPCVRSKCVPFPRSIPTAVTRCCCSVAKSCPTLRDPMDRRHQAAPSFAFSRGLLQLQYTESVTPSNHLILRHPLLLLPSIFPSMGVFPNEFSLYIVLGHVASSSH